MRSRRLFGNEPSEFYIPPGAHAEADTREDLQIAAEAQAHALSQRIRDAAAAVPPPYTRDARDQCRGKTRVIAASLALVPDFGGEVRFKTRRKAKTDPIEIGRQS